MQRPFGGGFGGWYGRMAVCLLVVVACCPWPSDTARVLAMETFAAKSHWYFMKGVLRALADRGHRVTVYTPYPNLETSATDNYTEVDTYDFYRGKDATGWEITKTVMHFSRPSIIVPKIVNESHRVCEVMDRFLSRDVGDYDLFITEPLSSDCVSHAARRLGVPLVYVVPAPLLPWIETAAFGHYSNPAVVPHLFAAYAVPDTFYRRLHSVAMHLYTVFANYWCTATAAAVQRRPYDLAPPVKPSLVFVNTHHITEPPRPVPANRVDVGGIHLTGPQPLPAVSTTASRRALSAS